MPRRLLRVRGTVQGVGFRPFVYRLALELGLGGAVWNDADGVVIDAEGPPEGLEALRERILVAPPPRAIVETVEVFDAAPLGARTFSITESDARSPASARVSPDLATCEACLVELADPGNRRFAYPFINCVDCGPRYSIAQDVPYDRPRTTMARFTQCVPCAAEYGDPLSRRFHAQPNACPECGPHVWIAGAGITGAAAVSEAVAALRRGAIVAVKGLGGFHLACDALQGEAVRRLREKKQRGGKPFAVMFPDLRSLETEAVLGPLEREVLSGSRRPIVLLPRRAGGRLAPGVAPGLTELGAMLPYTPLHHLLLGSHQGPLVMTSGNLSEEPITASNEEALGKLGNVADLLLLHDRDIHMRADDSVVRVLMGKERVLRRSRGHVPQAIRLGFDFEDPVLAIGADLKNTLCLAAGGAAILSQHIGDLESYEAMQFGREVRENLERLFGIRPRFVAHDLHPGYHSTALAQRLGLPTLAVQHHHAHIASCLADNGRTDPVIGVAWDGTGYGTDGTSWGGEFLIADLGGFRRVGRIRPVPAAGGDAAVREPFRMAVAHLWAAGLPASVVRHPRAGAIEAMIREGINVIPTSSAGRLFDAVASLLGLRDISTYEGQAAMELEAASSLEVREAYAWHPSPGDPWELDPAPLVTAILEDIHRGVDLATIGGRFHNALAVAIAEMCERVREVAGLGVVALSGGCFQSRLLTLLASERLASAGFEVLLHERVPPNDGGIALGQAAVAAYRPKRVSP